MQTRIYLYIDTKALKLPQQVDTKHTLPLVAFRL